MIRRPRQQVKSDLNPRVYALKLISVRDRSVKELINKLMERGYDDAAVGETIEYLRAKGYLDDKKIAESIERYCAETRIMGAAGVRGYARRRGVPEGLVREMAFDAESEVAKALRLVKKKERYLSDILEGRDTARLFRYLQRRGFDAGTINRVVKELDMNGMEGGD